MCRSVTLNQNTTVTSIHLTLSYQHPMRAVATSVRVHRRAGGVGWLRDTAGPFSRPSAI